MARAVTVERTMEATTSASCSAWSTTPSSQRPLWVAVVSRANNGRLSFTLPP
jgi:hypothetical protein